jgi:hypothetical protein
MERKTKKIILVWIGNNTKRGGEGTIDPVATSITIIKFIGTQSTNRIESRTL